MENIGLGYLILAKWIFYTAAFSVFGYLFLNRHHLSTLGWALLGGISRLFLGFMFGFGLVLLLWKLQPHGYIVCLAFGLLRFTLWWSHAAYFYNPPVRKHLIFAAVMTGANFTIDILLFGWPQLSDLGKTWKYPGLH